ncbi:MAG: glycosyl transferase family 28 [Bacteroidetes bacterium]|nr:MAG: glycosyl transferase family 28 [Bacteroidota bacterium]
MFFGEPAKILVAPLDWGLGHATRCIPIIKLLLARNCTIALAADGPQKALLQQEFPGLEFIRLPSYGISYSGNDFLNSLKIATQIPKIMTRISQENRCLEKYLMDHKWDAVISDNRYGLHAKGLHSVFITHQLHIENPLGRAFSGLLRNWNYRFIERFNQCWIPDFENGPGWAGKLSHPDHLPHIPCRYIGPLSRFVPLGGTSQEYDLLIILSGPEPQRSRFEKILIDQLKLYKGKVAVVRGLPQERVQLEISSHVTVYNHRNAAELNHLIEASNLVIARSGYSTLMDLLSLETKVIVVPTPGQSEQIYLARYLSEKKLVMAASQLGFDLAGIIERAQTFPFAQMEVRRSFLLEQAINDLLEKLRRPSEK